MDRHGLLVLTAPPLAFASEDYLDHAGRWETAALLASFPELVDIRHLQRALAQYPAGHVADLGILGALPLDATAAGGEIAIEQSLQVIAQWVQRLLHDGDPQPLRDFYAVRRAAYQAFIDRYGQESTPEDAATRWWADRVRRD